MIEPNPAVDVLIPVRNRARYIANCLDSVLAQTLQPNAIVVVDDGSTDDTPAILAQYARAWSKLHVIHSVPRGVSHARNLGLAACTAPLVAFLDSDDVWRADKLERQIALFRPDRPELGFVHCGLLEIDEFGRLLANSRKVAPQKRGYVFEDVLENFYPICGSASAVVARRELVVALGGFDETLFHAEDKDLWLKLAHVSHIDYVPDALVSLRVHDDNSQAQARRDKDELFLFQRLRVWNKWLDHIDNIDRVLEAFRSDAIGVGVKRAFSAHPDFGIYGRLKKSDLHLASRLFPSPASFLSRGVKEMCRPLKIDALPPWVPPDQIRNHLKRMIAERLILRSKLLLRMSQVLGKFKNVSE